jgi:hypothetical protein
LGVPSARFCLGDISCQPRWADVLNYAQWKDEASFKGFLNDPETKRLQAAISAVDPALKPHAIHCRDVRTIGSPE